MDLKALLSILNSPETREVLLKAVDFVRLKGQVNDLQNQVRRMQAESRDDSKDIERLDDKLDALAKSIDSLRTRAMLSMGLGGGALVLGLVALIVALR
jgi:chromosome segregation ATPase